MASATGRVPTVAVIGAGSAGRAAAGRLADHEVSVVVFDEQSIDGVPDQPTIAIYPNTLVWGLFPDRIVGYLSSPDEAALMQVDAVIVATGSSARSVAFPGWTLSGVVTPDDLDHEAFSRVPARRIAIVGIGAEVTRVRDELAAWGADVVAAIDVLARTPARGGQPLRIVAHGGPAVNRVGIDAGAPDAAAAEEYTVDMLCVAFGRNPITDLARMVQCAVAYGQERGGWFVTHDEGMRTSQPSYYVAGACTGREGENAARAMGELAALTVLRDLDVLNAAEYMAVAAEAQQRLKADEVGSAAQTRAARTAADTFSAQIAPNMVICPCEGVTAATVDDALDLGARTLNDVKRYTRCCMGMCQGRICASIVAGYVEHRAGIAPEQFGQITARPPVRPILLSAMAALDD